MIIDARSLSKCSGLLPSANVPTNANPVKGVPIKRNYVGMIEIA